MQGVRGKIALAFALATLACAPAPDIGDRIAGTWLGRYEVDVPGFPKTAFISTYHADGTGITSSGRAFGAGDPDRNGLSSAHHIEWEAAGAHEIRWRLLHFNHAGDGSLKSISRTYGTLRFDKTFENATGAFQVEVHAADTLLAPLDPNVDAEPIFRGGGRSVLRRLGAAPPSAVGGAD